ncbi:MAG: hypothetical protein HQK91_00435 [Nitrospirae bacterium]|nr:hypothetical protein [Nitrospirota bacterium]MBF0539903.1 hypothetical protein [Nitrospirota bacterium]
MNNDLRYKIAVSGETLSLLTTSFRAERKSVLHSGIYTKELSSMFAAFIVSFIYIIYVSFISQLHWLNFIIASVGFIVLFPICRIFIFKEHLMSVIFDKSNNLITITQNCIIGKKIQQKKLSSLSEITIDHKMIEPQNQDGIEFVKKISLSHGAPMPDLGSIEHFYNINLAFSNGLIMIFSAPDQIESEGLVKIIREFCFDISKENTCQKELI